jgi:hypothetical protein
VRSRSERRAGKATRAAVAVLAILLAHGTGAVDALGAKPSESQVSAAVEQLKRDPDLASQRKIRVLHWAGQSDSDAGPRERPAWWRWIESLFEWLMQGGRFLIWAACAVLAALLVIYLLRTLRMRVATAASTVLAPTHVRDLDIRPESLPDDMGAASRELWSRGEHRAALALLYRGCLSRLAHVYRVPIRDATTEGECIALAAGQLSGDSATYVSRLVSIWQRAVYRGEEPSAELMSSLCDGFAGALDPPPPPSPTELAA